MFVPVGGGGLIAGIGAYIQSLRPDIRIIGVEPHDANAMAAALDAGHPVRLEHVGVFADGVAVQQVGAQTFPIVRATVREIVRVTNDDGAAIMIFSTTRAIAEPAGRAGCRGAAAAAERHAPYSSSRHVSGAN